MELTLDTLELAFAPVEQIGKEELVIPVGSTSVTLRPLMPEEESEVQKAAATTTGDPDDPAAVTDAIEYIERFKVAVLSYAIVAVGDNDFRGVRFVETNETLDNGKKVKIPIHQAMRKMVLKWGGPTRTQIFRNYSELLLQLEHKAEEAIKYEPSDVDTELERAKARVARLEAEIERRKKPQTPGIVPNQVHAIANQSQEEIPQPEAPQVTQAARVEPEAPVVAPAPEPAPAVRVPVRPNVAPPPPPPSHVSQPQSTVNPALTKEHFLDPKISFDDIPDSFAAPDDAEAIEMENRRLFEQRRQMLQAQKSVQQTEAPSVIEEARDRFGARRPPHMGAAETAASLDADQPVLYDEGASLGRGQPEILARRPEAPPTVQPVRDSRNPRFNPTRGRV